jgi:hypothetical protein
MSETQHTQPPEQHQPGEPARATRRPLHRVCIQCNNMFVVTPEHFDAKQCPNCHKG